MASNGIVLKKPTFIKVDQLQPDSRGVNVILKVKTSHTKLEKDRQDGSKMRIGEAIAGDDTGMVTLTLRGEQIETCQPGKTIVVRNGKIQMFKGHIRLEVDKWGKIVQAEEEAKFEINEGNDVSSTEYELVTINEG
ncbi:unnamed protein product [Vitrella brassicaformis CCMP3155]|uniref:Single-stranded DNA binding protein Ssb-like OB fold domain-containing protein n=2 Tax=Vitrella brassicaformis TaxID=1169539 RepID=A0A0G4EE40_VITBC|nr:unnamed protein product [Vitrella brassicaformis CCMP3155]|mmetsp:Transcript_50981/g.127836  ORF Transcript_50981/g.127836 Transcript_50981/m.127836 type:complete len:136 (+) Transcript_50981:120-527(+)|eukprot:CEL94242.1 unnamed protein product [Vitrella brassicaformis CCMP3155]